MGHNNSKLKKKGGKERRESKSKLKLRPSRSKKSVKDENENKGSDSPTLQTATTTTATTAATATTSTSFSATTSSAPSTPRLTPKSPRGKRPKSIIPKSPSLPSPSSSNSRDRKLSEGSEANENSIPINNDVNINENGNIDNNNNNNEDVNVYNNASVNENNNQSSDNKLNGNGIPHSQSSHSSLGQSSESNISEDRNDNEGGEKKEGGRNKLAESTIFEDDEKNGVEGHAHDHYQEEDEVEEQCDLCLDTDESILLHTLEVCGHNICTPCLLAYSEQQLKELSPETHEVLCPVRDCKCIVSASDLRAALETFSGAVQEIVEGGEGSSGAGDGAPGSSESSVPVSLPIQLTQSLEVLLSKGNYVHCPNPNCKFVFEKLPPTPRIKGEVVRDDLGNPISPEAMRHREEYRFRCRVCDTNFCAACKSIPYHLGFTCKQKMAALRAKHCRFCDVVLPANTKPHPYSVLISPTITRPEKKKEKRSRSFLMTLGWKGKERSKSELPLPELPDDNNLEENPREYFVCKSRECITKMNTACPRFVKCNHPCSGVSSDWETECFCLKEGCCESGQNADEFCNICWVESLGSAPCIKLRCSHVFHDSCLRSKLNKQWPGPAISFSFMNCPLCSQVIHNRVIDYIVQPFVQIYEQVKTKALQRLEFEGMMNDPRVTNTESDFYNKPAEYAMSIFSFYMCYICKIPYFGGRRQCEVQAEGADAAAYNPAELLCGGCSTLNAECKKHGKEYIEFKCRFCCSLATFYCGGKAHFCTPCHDKAGQLVEFVHWNTIAKCEPCKGPEVCPLGVSHADNGEECSLGCSMCRAGV